MEYGPVTEPRKGNDHITPEEQYVRSFGEFQISQNDEKRSLQEKKQGHLDQIPCKSHQANRECEEPEYSKHACHGKSSSLCTIIDCLHNIIPGKEKGVNRIGYESEFFFLP